VVISVFTAGLVAVASPANAISCNAFNQGTGNAFHVQGANGNGLYKIASACHGG